MKCRTLLLASGAAALVLGAHAPPIAAQGNTCGKDINPTYTDRCGPSFVLPTWGDGGGGNKPQQYETIQLADVDGDGDDELLARTPAGVEIHVFDKTYGQWRPQMTTVTVNNDARQVPVILTEFADPPPLTDANPTPATTDWRQPQYYDTIQAADIDGDKRAEVLGRSADGIIVYKYTPSQGGQPGTWKQLTTSGPMPDSGEWNEGAYYYATIQTGDIDGDRDAELVARGSGGIEAFDWTGSGWRTVVGDGSNMFPDPTYKDPKYWTTIQLADIDGNGQDEVLGRTPNGMIAYEVLTGNELDSGFGPFSFGDCPAGAPSNCFDTGPAYYATIQAADINGNGRAELLGRAPDGLHVWRYQGDSPDAYGRLPTLTDLSDQNGYSDQSRWETIQFADINGDQRAEALARDGNGVNAWTYDPARKAWTKLAPTTALALADDPWASDRSYYSTIQTGDVDGDRRADVVARGPYGIRTWFYDRRKTGGWESYLAEGYPAFSCHPVGDPTSCEQAAFDELNKQARAQGIPGGGSNVRDVWTSPSGPTSANLNTLQTRVTAIGDCVNGPGPPAPYATCTPPQGSTGFDADDWTNVVNQILAEIYWAQQVYSLYYDPDEGLREVWDILLTEQAEQLDVIASGLKVDAAAQTSTEWSPSELWSAALGSIGALLAMAEPESLLVPFFWFTSEAASVAPSDDPEVNDPFDSTLLDLKDKLTQRASRMTDSLAEQAEVIRMDQRLLTLVGQLVFSGAWTTNFDAMRSGARQGFALWVYRHLLPLLWGRYSITNCQQALIYCAAPDARGAWFTGDSNNFTMLGPVASSTGPCAVHHVGHANEERCIFVGPQSDTANELWGHQPAECVYNPLSKEPAKSVWAFPGSKDAQGKVCSLGVDPRATLAGDPSTGWTFPQFTGNPDYRGAASALAGSASGIGVGPPVERAGAAAQAGRRRGGGVMRLRGRTPILRSVRLRHARVIVDRLLFEAGGAGETVRQRAGRRLPPLILRRRAGTAGLFVTRRPGGPRVGLRLRRSGRRFLSFRLAASGLRMPLPPAACAGTRPEVDITTYPFTLHSAMRIDDGRRRPLRISLKPQWTCRRDRLGNVRRLVLQPPRYRAPRGRSPAVAVRAPRRVRRGGRATISIRVRNRRRTTAHDVLVQGALPRSLAPGRARGARVVGRQVLWRWRKLGPGRSRTVRLPLRPRRSAAGRICLEISASAFDTRAARKRVCVRIAR